jgi:hypothetical protein
MVLNKYKILFLIILTKLLATSFSLFVFDHYSPLVDAKMFQNESYFNSQQFRTYLIQIITAITNFLTSPLISHYIFSIFSILGILWLVISRNVRWPILLILFLPTSMIFTSVIGKESVFYLCFSLILIIWNDYINDKFTVKHFLILFLALSIGLTLRPHYAICLIWLFWAAFILKNTSNYKLLIFIPYCITICIFLLIIFFGENIDPLIKMNIFDLRWTAFSAIDVNGGASRHYDLGFNNLALANQQNLLKHFNSFFGLGFIFGIVGPLPSELINRPEFIPFFIEGLTILISPLLILFFLIKRNLYKSDNINCLNYIYGVLPTIVLIMLIHAFFGVLNPGTAIRWRVNFELIFYFAPLLLYFNLLESKNENNITSSS